MAFVADILMLVGTIAVAGYCLVLSARLKRFSTLETGMGGAVAVLSAQVDDMTRALDRAKATANGSAVALEALTARAEMVAARLEVLLATMHDLPEPRTGSGAMTGERKLRFTRRRPVRETLEAGL